MTAQRPVSFSSPEEMDGLIGFIFVRSLFLGIRPSKNAKNFLQSFRRQDNGYKHFPSPHGETL